MAASSPTNDVWSPSAGDLAFYSGDWTKPLDVAIMLRTRSPIVHVAVIVDSLGKTIAATSTGIQDGLIGDASFVADTHAALSTPRLAPALDWLNTKIGQPYGWADILNQELLAINKSPVLLDKSYDCSHLACCFLWIAGALLDAWMIDEFAVTPADLYKWARDMVVLRTLKGQLVG